jgi:adenine/guanine/hypoxanthine permease
VKAHLEKYFQLSAHGTTVSTELLAGLTTFLTMAYIIFVQPAVLSGAMFDFETGMDFGSVMVATCLGAAIASAIMGLYARYPIAQAPGMGQNFFFVLTAIPAATAAGFTNAWETALGVVFISGILFLLLSFFKLRETILNALSPSLKNAIAVGIGLFIAFIGLQNAGVINKSPATGVTLNHHFASPDLIVFFIGLIIAGVCHARKIRGSILWGILAATITASIMKIGMPAGWAETELVKNSHLVQRFEFAKGVVSMPPPISPTLFKMDIGNALSLAMLPFVIVFLFMVLFDTVGTLVGVAEQAGMIHDNRLPRAQQAFTSDALGTTIGACLGTSTVTAYIESAAGVEQGGRTGLTSVTVAILFLLALFFSPVIAMIGSYPSLTAPALVLVGAMMFGNVAKIDWRDFTEAFPAFVIIVGIPFSYSIGDGLALGFICYPLVKLLSGRGRGTHWIVYFLAVFLVLYFVFVRSKIG